MDRTQIRERSLFPYILCFIFMLHMVPLILKITMDDSARKIFVKTPEQSAPMVIKIRKFDTRKQIVQSGESENKEAKEGAFLSDKTRSFDRQTRARVTDVFNQSKGKGGGGGQKTTKKKKIKLSDLGHATSEDPFKKAAEDYTNQRNGKGKGIGSGIGNQKGQDRAVSSTNDYLEDIPLGDMTNLNTVEYKYYGFYHRIRQKLEQFWGRSLQEKAEQLAKSGRRVPASEELVTALQITLSDTGKILSIKIMGSSGVKELDDAAIESFNAAGPFPNPPKGLIVNGRVTLEWGFVVKSG